MNIKSLFVGDTNNTFVQFFRYCFVGGFAFVIDSGILFLLVETVYLNEAVAAAIAFIFGLVANYILSTFWIFKNSKMDNKLQEFIAFAIIGVIGLLMNSGIIWFFQSYLAGINIIPIIPQDKYYLLGKVASTVIVFVWNFFARKIFVFK